MTFKCFLKQKFKFLQIQTMGSPSKYQENIISDALLGTEYQEPNISELNVVD